MIRCLFGFHKWIYISHTLRKCERCNDYQDWSYYLQEWIYREF